LLFRIATYIFVLFRSQEKIPAIQALPEEFHFRSGYKVQANFCVVTEWVPIDNAVARKEITKRERHFNVSKSSFISSVHSDAATVNPRDVLIDDSKQADIENLGDCLRVLGDGQTLGDFSLTIILYADMRGFEINDIGAQTRIRAVITVPSCSTSSGSGSEHCFASFVRIRVCCWRILPSVNNSLSLNANILDQESVYLIVCSGSLPDDSGPTGNTGSSWSRLIRSCAGIARDSDSIGD
jgi:hypothetical protein